jgi:hypothetical protein
MAYGLHDGHIISYEVRCFEREIELKVALADSGSANALFLEVQGYHFKHDAFGNIISNIEEVPAAKILGLFSAEIREAFRLDGAYGIWASNMETAESALNALGTRGYLLSCSIGLDGWILAKEIIVKRTDSDSNS